MPNSTETLPSGILETAGTFLVDGCETTGFVVACSRAEIRALQHLPMYQRVVVLPADLVDGYTVRASDYDQLANAARELRSACKRLLPPGSYAQLDKECGAIDALLCVRPEAETHDVTKLKRVEAAP